MAEYFAMADKERKYQKINKKGIWKGDEKMELQEKDPQKQLDQNINIFIQFHIRQES